MTDSFSEDPGIKQLVEVAKRGLDDPAALMDLDVLLALPAVTQESGNSSDPLELARALVRVINDALDSLCDEAQAATDSERDVIARRRDVSDVLFQRLEKWKGIPIGKRRCHLLGDPDGRTDTTRFRRTEELALYRLVVDYSTSPFSAQPMDIREDQAFSSISHSAFDLLIDLEQALHFHEIGRVELGLPDLWAEELLIKFVLFSESEKEFTFFPTSNPKIRPSNRRALTALRARGVLSCGPLNWLDLSRLRHVRRSLSAFDEPAPFIDYLKRDEDGKTATRKVRSWVESCCCEVIDEELEQSPECQPHKAINELEILGWLCGPHHEEIVTAFNNHHERMRIS